MDIFEIIDFLGDFKPNAYKTRKLSKKKDHELTEEDKIYLEKNKAYKSKIYKQYRDRNRKNKYYKENQDKLKDKAYKNATKKTKKDLNKKIENLEKKLQKEKEDYEKKLNSLRRRIKLLKEMQNASH